MKRTFASRTFASRTFDSATWTGGAHVTEGFTRYTRIERQGKVYNRQPAEEAGALRRPDEVEAGLLRRQPAEEAGGLRRQDRTGKLYRRQ